MWPVHTWLPDTCRGSDSWFGYISRCTIENGWIWFLRFSIPMFPEASDFFSPLVFALSVVAIIYTSLVALAQDDLKKLIAYSSVAHMGFVTIGIFTLNSRSRRCDFPDAQSWHCFRGSVFMRRCYL